ncbi:hypothetical protein MYK68_16115 [Gordonia sp. PP30]|uniref:hypothetical protein n=1 Tax=Gordonia sp. PP30 TaxID=2935861 RepID=UPI0020001587|nr:hypothetical protein [Gordonia sp. PP30]UQE74237.1 hypothetical protein MYK68_16115 [Gordonia sp. PP30]
MRFRTFDAQRGDDQRHVQHEMNLTVRVDETDEFITVPVRTVFTDDGLIGWTFEFGPYSLSDADVRNLANAVAHFGRVSGEFHPIEGGAA